MAEEFNNLENMDVSSMYAPSFDDIKVGQDPLALLQTDYVPFVPPLPDGTPVPPKVNTQITGDYFSGPAPGANPNVTSQVGTLDFTKSAINAMQDNNWATDKYKYGRTYSYGAGYKAANFDRYYNHPKFKEFGFSPYRDNDAYYNEKGSWWDDFQRMSTQYLNVAWAGGPKNLYGDEKLAYEDFQRAMDIGQSTRGGVGSWVTNFGLNSAFTVGIIGTIWAENLALAAIEAASLTTATPEVLAVMAARNTRNFGKLARGMAGISDFMKEMKAANYSKEFFTWAKMGEAAKNTASYLNPLGRTFETTKNILNGTKGFDLLQNKAKFALGFGDFYRDLREINVAHSEARLEGEGAAVKYQDDAIDEFFEKNNRMPDEQESKDIFERAQSVKHGVILANDIGIYLTNKIAFHDLFEGIRPGAKLSKIFTDDFRNTMKKASMKGFKIGMDVVTPGVKTAGKATADFLFKSAYSPLSRKYFLGNLGEALQENYQELVQSAAIDYELNIQKDPSQAGYYGAVASIGKGLNEQFSNKGLDTFLQGYLMGSIIQAGGVGIQAVGDYAFKSKEQRQEAKANRKDYLNNTMNAVNSVGKNVMQYGSGAKFSDALAEIRQSNARKRAAKERGDEKAMHDAGDETNINHFYTVVSSGNTKIVLDHFDDLLSLSDEDLLNAAEVEDPSAAPQVRAKIEKAKERLAQFDRAYKYQQKAAPNPYNPNLFNPKKNPDEYNFELDRYNGYERTMRDILFAQEDHARMSERLSAIYNSAANQSGVFKDMMKSVNPGNTIGATAGSDITMLLDPKQRQTFFQGINERIKILRNGDSEQKKEADFLETQNKILKDWINHVHNVVKETKLEKRAVFNPKTKEQIKERSRHRIGAKIRTPEGEEGKITDVYGDKITIKLADKTTKEVNRDNIEVLEDSDQLTLDLSADNENEIDFAINSLYNTYESYIRHVSKMKNGYVLNDHLHESFRHILDFITLELDKEDIITTLNTLNDPNFRSNYEAIQANVQKIKREQDYQAKMEALNKFEDLKADNKMLNELYDLGVRILPEDVEKVKDYTIVDFYDVKGKEYVDYSSPEYKQIVDIIEKYAEQAHRMVTGKQIEEEADGASIILRMFNSVARKRLKNDKRTFRDLAIQFGFSPTATETKVSTRDLLVKIVESKFSTDREKRLARRLLTVVEPNATINIVRNLTTPASFNSATNELSIDPRHSSIEYKAGEKGNPFEHVILNQTLMSIAKQGLLTDTEFSDKITKLRERAISYQGTAAYKAKYGDRPMLGLADNAEFITAALTNDLFQSALRETPYQTTGKVSDAWTDFVNSIKKFFARMFGVDISNTLLDESLYIISSKLDEEPIEPKGGETTVKPETTVTTPIDQIRSQNPVLYDDLLTAYKLFARKEGKTIPESDDEIGESLGFKNFVESNSDALEIISKAAPARPKAAPVAPTAVTETEKEGEPVELDKDTEEKLYEEIEIVLQTFDEPSDYKYQIVSNPKYNFEEIVLILGNKQWGIEAITNSNNYKQGDERAINLLKEQNRLQDILDERIRKVMEKYNLDFVKEQIPGAPAPAAVTEEPTTTAGVYTPTTLYGTPTGEPLTTATTPVSTDAKADIEKQKDAFSKLINGEYSAAYGLDPMGIPTDSEFDITQGISKTILKGVKLTNEELEEFLDTAEKDRNEFFKRIAQNRLAALEGKVVEPISKPKEEEVSDSVKTFNSSIAAATKQDQSVKEQKDKRSAAAQSGEKNVDMRAINAYLGVRGNNIREAFKELFKDKPANNIINTIENLLKKGITIYQKTGKDDFTINNYNSILERINKLDRENITDSQLKDIVDSFINISANLYQLGNIVNYNTELAGLEVKKSEVSTKDALAEEKVKTDIIELKDVFKWDDNKKSYNRTAKLVKDKDGNTLGVDVLNVDRKVYTIEAANIDPELLRQLEEVERKYIFRGQTKQQLSNIRKEARVLYKEIASKEIARLTGKEVIPTTEEKIKSLDDVYEDIGNMDQLDEWYQRGIAEQIPAEILDQKRQNKINELAKKINFTDLKDWQEVYVKGDTTPRVVYDPTGEGVKKGEVILLHYGDYLAGDMKSAIKVTPENINSIIESIPNPAMKEVIPTGPTVTEEQVKESNATVNSLNNPEVIDDEQFKKIIEDAKAGKADDFLKMINQEIEENNNCSTSSGTKEE